MEAVALRLEAISIRLDFNVAEVERRFPLGPMQMADDGQKNL